jgi:hypothetical protein
MFTLCEFQDCVKLKPCTSFPLNLACVESLMRMNYGKNQGCGSDVQYLIACTQ